MNFDTESRKTQFNYNFKNMFRCGSMEDEMFAMLLRIIPIHSISLIDEKK